MAFVFYLSQQPAPLEPIAGGVNPVLGHIVVFAFLAVLLYVAVAPPAQAAPRWVPASIAFALAVLYGVSDEIHQAFVPGRVASEADVFADAIGAAIGVAAVLIVSRRLSFGPRNTQN
jgi:VanZ family protein